MLSDSCAVGTYRALDGRIVEPYHRVRVNEAVGQQLAALFLQELAIVEHHEVDAPARCDSAHDVAFGLAPVSDAGQERLVAHSNGECTRSAPQVGTPDW